MAVMQYGVRNLFRKCTFFWGFRRRGLCTYVERPKSKNIFKLSLIGASFGITLGAAYALKRINDSRQKLVLEGVEIKHNILKYKPNVKTSRRIISPLDTTGLKLTLFQYQTCPFCCKLLSPLIGIIILLLILYRYNATLNSPRAHFQEFLFNTSLQEKSFTIKKKAESRNDQLRSSVRYCKTVRVLLDYYGLSYDVVEVNPVMRKEISWSDYKKVPILLTKVTNGYQPLNDSSMVISTLTSYLHDRTKNIEDLVSYYPITAVYNEKGRLQYEVINKYFLMYQNSIPKNRTLDSIVEEREWRKWTDEVFVHTLSPNVYRTLPEAYETFKWFSKVGHWEEYFPAWERIVMIHVGALAMWMISKKLRKRHNLKNNVRESFYDQINVWLNGIKAKGGTFMGGAHPDLSDLAVYGMLTSIEGCKAFKDAIIFTNLGTWFYATKEKVESHSGCNFYIN